MTIQENVWPSGNDEKDKKTNVEAEEGSQSDPQLTELDGLKKGGIEPHVHPDDLAKDNKGKKDN
ncbi:MAG: hypothetical protein ABI415_01800 [Flavitalea sp.]